MYCTTPVPNEIFDRYMPILKPAELKVLLVIVRQTYGWVKYPGAKTRKEIDWISGSQLSKKTGYTRRAITDAVASLLKRRLIQVQDRDGLLLDTPERRQGQLRLYYRYAKHEKKVRMSSEKRSQLPRKKVLITKETLTKETQQNLSSEEISERMKAIREELRSKMVLRPSSSGVI